MSMHNLLLLERSSPLEETDVVNGLISFGRQAFLSCGLLVVIKRIGKGIDMVYSLKSRFWRNRARDWRTIDK